MEGVVFVSRSFADELLDICQKNYSTIINTHGVVDTIIRIVKKSRESGKKKRKGSEEIVELQDMVSLETYFAKF